MAGRRSDVLDVREMLRRLRLGESARAIARDLGSSRNTVRDYAEWFKQLGLLAPDAPFLTAEALHALLEQRAAATPPATPPMFLPYRDEITALVETPLQLTVALQRFSEAHPDVRASYVAFRRFVRRYIASAKPSACLRLEVAAGTEAQVDFGYAGLIPPRPGESPRKTWVFVMTLAHSRHQYIELVQDQAVTTWLLCHRHAFEFFGGTPAKIVLDNLKAGIIKASVTDPEVQRAYRDLAEHYGFVVSPCVPRTPRHKGKVERGVRYVRRSFLAGRTFASLDDGNAAAVKWVLEIAGVRIHGTTREVPLDVFAARERPALIELPSAAFELVEYKQVKLHPDCHVVFYGSYYSAPYGFVGQRLWLRATWHVVQLFVDHKLVRTHARSHRPGTRVQNAADFPPEKMQYLMRTPVWCRQRAGEIGPHVAEFIEQLLGDKTLDRLRGAQATLRLVDTVGAARLDAACRRALACDAIAHKSVKAILHRGLEAEPLPGEIAAPPPAPPAPAYVRTFLDLFDEIARTETANPKGDDPWTSSTN